LKGEGKQTANKPHATVTQRGRIEGPNTTRGLILNRNNTTLEKSHAMTHDADKPNDSNTNDAGENLDTRENIEEELDGIAGGTASGVAYNHPYYNEDGAYRDR
jgi:hypothetical protein